MSRRARHVAGMLLAGVCVAGVAAVALIVVKPAWLIEQALNRSTNADWSVGRASVSFASPLQIHLGEIGIRGRGANAGASVEIGSLDVAASPHFLFDGSGHGAITANNVRAGAPLASLDDLAALLTKKFPFRGSVTAQFSNPSVATTDNNARLSGRLAAADITFDAPQQSKAIDATALIVATDRDIKLRVKSDDIDNGLSRADIQFFVEPKTPDGLKVTGDGDIQLSGGFTKGATADGDKGGATEPARGDALQARFHLAHLTVDGRGSRPVARPAGGVDGAFNVAGLKTGDVQLLVSGVIDELALNAIVIRDIRTRLTFDKNVLDATALANDFYGGGARARYVLNASEPFTHELSLSASPRDYSELIYRLTGFRGISGSAKASLDVQAIGSDIDTILKTAKGISDIALTGAKIDPSNLSPLARMIQQGIGQNALGATFDDITCSFAIHDGRAASDNLRGDGPLLSFTGDGTIAFIDRTLDFHITPSLGSRGNSSLFNISVPLHVSGPWAAPSFSAQAPDLSNAISGVSRLLDGSKSPSSNGPDIGGILDLFMGQDRPPNSNRK